MVDGLRVLGYEIFELRNACGSGDEEREQFTGTTRERELLICVWGLLCEIDGWERRMRS